MRTIRLGAGQGFYGDSPQPIADVLDDGVDYLCCEALAELTLAILQKDRQKDEALGYTKDLPAYARLALPRVHQGTRWITNAGGINPSGAMKALHATAKAMEVAPFTVGLVTGDDLLGRLDQLEASGADLSHLETGETFDAVRGKVLFANAYLGGRPIAEALDAGADAVLTGRVADAALFLGPLLYEFGWTADDWDRLAAGTVIGHLCECSGQAAGGNFSGRWWDVENHWRYAFPIAECNDDGTAVITKAKAAGGRISFDTLKEQLLYEVGDPRAYISPDVVADFTSLRMEDIAPDRVALSGMKGRPATDSYKVVMAYPAGWSAESRMVFSWPNAHAKARRAADTVRRRWDLAGVEPLEIREEYFGWDALHGPGASSPPDPPEVMLRLAIRMDSAEAAGRAMREVVPLGLSGPPSSAGAGRGGGGPSELLGMWSCLVPKNLVDPHVRVVTEKVG